MTVTKETSWSHYRRVVAIAAICGLAFVVFAVFYINNPGVRRGLAAARLRDCAQEVGGLVRVTTNESEWQSLGGLHAGDVIFGINLSNQISGKRQTPMPRCFRELVWFNETLGVLVINDRTIGHGDASIIGQCSHLKRLYAAGTRMSDGTLSTILQKCGELEELELTTPNGNMDVGDTFADARRLKSLILSYTLLGPRSMKAIGRLPNLTVLSLVGCKIGDEEVAALLEGGCTSLKEVGLSLTQISDDSVRLLSRCDGIRELQLGGAAGVSGNGLSVLSRMRQLESLSLDGTLVTDEALRELSGLPALRELRMTGTNITGEGLLVLGRSRSLRHVRIGQSNPELRAAAALLMQRNPLMSVISVESYE